MRPFLFSALLATALLWLAPAAQAATALAFSSGPAAVALLELYTSEGCSSCPPAEKSFALLRDDPGLWRDFVPLVFHVDYWNRLGWPDRFSRADFTQRQYRYAAAWDSASVYTPCLVRNGREHRGALAPSPATRATAGRLRVTYDRQTLRADYTPDPTAAHASAPGWEIHAALLGGGIVSRVTAGENRGATLRHEFVVLALVHGPAATPLALPPAALAGVPRHALAVWATAPGDLTPVQATGGWID